MKNENKNAEIGIILRKILIFGQKRIIIFVY